jgi:glycolate oxidase iron-sulfur subunit
MSPDCSVRKNAVRPTTTAVTPTAPEVLPLQQALQDADTSCIKCGFCLPTCPTYRLTGNEAASPRGRIDLMQAVARGELAAGDIFEQLDFCLGCRACETACPADVEFSVLLEAGRAAARADRDGSFFTDWLRHIALHTLLPSPWRLRLLTGLLRFYQTSGLQQFLRNSGILQRLSSSLATLETMLPTIPAAAERRAVAPETMPTGDERGQVAILTGCVMPELLPQINQATVRVLSMNGYRVLAPAAQRCCGALQAHAGELEKARELARHAITVFEATKAEWIVVNSAGCGATMKTYGHLLADDTAFATRAAKFSNRVRDVSEVLAAEPLRPPLTPMPIRVAYDDPCHLLHGQKVSAPPRDLLRQIPQLQLVDIPEGDWCCGSAGIYNLVHPGTAQDLLDRKIAHLASVQPQMVVTGNPGCILQLRHGVARHGLNISVTHPVEILAQAYERATS